MFPGAGYQHDDFSLFGFFRRVGDLDLAMSSDDFAGTDGIWLLGNGLS